MTVAYFPTSADADVRDGLLTLVAGDSDNSIARGVRTVELAGRCRAIPCPLSDARVRLGEMAPAALWIEADEESDGLRDLLERVDEDVRADRYRTVIAIRESLIDFVTGIVSAPGIEIVVGTSELERTTVLAIATMPRASGGVQEAGNQASSAKLQQLSEEVSRIAAALASLSEPSPRPNEVIGTPQPPMGDMPQVSAESVRAVIKARRLRGRLLPEDLFADPAWDMLLDLLGAELVQHRVPVSSLCIAAAVPATTALRWIKTMTDRGLVHRRADPHDGRRIFIEMAPSTSSAMRRFFTEAGLAFA